MSGMHRKNLTRLEELQAIQRKHRGRLQPEDVVRYARRKKSSLHSCFTWDDGKAAHKWRVVEARRIIHLMVAPIEGSVEPIPIMVSLRSDRWNGGGYRSLQESLDNPATREQVLETAMIELQGIRARYKRMQELVGVFTSIDEVASRLDRKTKGRGGRVRLRKAA